MLWNGTVVMVGDREKAERLAFDTAVRTFEKIKGRAITEQEHPRLTGARFIEAEDRRAWRNPLPARWWFDFKWPEAALNEIPYTQRPPQ